MAPKCWSGSQFPVTPCFVDGSTGPGFRVELPGPFRRQTLYFPGRLPDLNMLLDARMRRSADETFVRSRRARPDGKIWNKYSAMKREAEQNIGMAILAAGLSPVPCAVFHFCLIEPQGKKRDPDNVAAGAIKLILDSLVRGKILPDDSQEHVLAVSWVVREAQSFATPHIVTEIFSPL